MIKAHCIEVSKGTFLCKYNLSVIDEICDMLSITITKNLSIRRRKIDHDMRRDYKDKVGKLVICLTIISKW